VTFELGINYWPRRSAMYMWREFDIAEVRDVLFDLPHAGGSLRRRAERSPPPPGGGRRTRGGVSRLADRGHARRVGVGGEAAERALEDGGAVADHRHPQHRGGVARAAGGVAAGGLADEVLEEEAGLGGGLGAPVVEGEACRLGRTARVEGLATVEEARANLGQSGRAALRAVLDECSAAGVQTRRGGGGEGGGCNCEDRAYDFSEERVLEHFAIFGGRTLVLASPPQPGGESLRSPHRHYTVR